jgi:hypothetical protein
MPNFSVGELPTDVYGITADEGKIAHITFTAAQAVAAGAVRAAITGSASETVLTTTLITNPPYPRNLVITPGGTTADVKAASITVTGTNIADEVITEDFAFLANATAPTVGNKAFKTVTSISIPAQDGAGATFATTFGDKLGLPYKFTVKPILWATFGGVIEATAPTMAVSATAVESNTMDLNTALDGTQVDLYMIL